MNPKSNVLPTLTTNNRTYRALVYPELLANSRLRELSTVPHTSHLNDISLGETVAPMFFSSESISTFYPTGIFGIADPLKVFNSVIGLISVLVVDDSLAFNRDEKCLRNKTVYANRFSSEPDGDITRFTRDESLRPFTPYSTVSGREVTAKTFDGLFIHNRSIS